MSPYALSPVTVEFVSSATNSSPARSVARIRSAVARRAET